MKCRTRATDLIKKLYKKITFAKKEREKKYTYEIYVYICMHVYIIRDIVTH